jgi:hypothetical protein
MPKRTNDFQELIALIHRQLAPTGATVTESALREDPVTKEPREADIVIQHEVAGYPVTIVIECRDEQRRGDVLWIEQLLGKYLTRASQVVAVSRLGFSKQARLKAAEVGITIMTVGEAKDTEWRTWVEARDSYWVTLHGLVMLNIFNINLVDKTITTKDVPPCPPGTDIGDIRFALADGTSLTAWEIFNRRAQDPALLAQSERQPDGLIRLRVGLPAGVSLVGPDGVSRGAEGIGYLVREEIETMRVPLKAGEYGATSIATGSAKGTDWKVLIAVVKDQTGKPQMSLRATKLSGPFPEGLVTLYGR